VVVDDDALVLKLIERRLRGSDLSLKTFTAPDDALVWLRGHRARLLLVDLRMRPMDGVELLETLEAEGRLRSTRYCVCTSALPTKEVSVAIERVGASVRLKDEILAPSGIERLLDTE